MSSVFQLVKIAGRIFSRDWRRGEMLNLIFALCLAMGSVSVIYLIIERVDLATDRQAADVLGADLVISSPKPMDPEWLKEAQRLNLEEARVVEFASVLFANDKLQLSAVKAVSSNYPLKGRIELADDPYQPATVVNSNPKRGEIWVEPRILSILSAKKSQPVEIGYIDLKIGGAIMLQPGQTSTLFNIAPSAIINIDDLEATKIIQPGSRVGYRNLFVGPKENIAEFLEYLKPKLNTSQRVATIFDESPMAGSAITRSKKYISLSGLLTLILLGVAIAMSANRYATRQFDMSALMRCFGMNNREVLLVFITILLLVSLVGIALGAVLGVAFQSLMVNWLSDLFGANLPPADLSVLIIPMLISFILLMGFALPSLVQLKSVPPMRVLRRQLEPMKVSSWSIYGLAISSILAVMYIQMEDAKLLFSVMAGLLMMAGIFILLSRLILSQVRRLSKFKSAAVNYSLRQLDANKSVTLLHLLAFSSTLFVIALVFIVRTELLSKWQQSLGDDAPNHFMVNIEPNAVKPIEEFLTSNDISASELYPMVRGRVTQVNGVDVKDALSEKARQHNSLRRELNMTLTNNLPKGNVVTGGAWGWDNTAGTESDVAKISIEDKMAVALGLQIGDQLTFTIGSENWVAQISSFRSIDWQTMTPNFYIIAEPGALEEFNPSYINAFFLPPDKKKLLADLISLYPAATIIELDRIFDEVRSIVTKVSTAVELIMFFVVGAGLILLLAAMEHTFAHKLRQSAILRTLGASRSFMATSFRFEFFWLAILSSFVAILCIELASYLLYERIFKIDFAFHFNLWWQLPSALFILMLFASWRGVNRVTNPAPLSLLK
jgi:putative ABC transport system permease protein